MFGSGAIDLVIGLLFVFLVFSLVVSGINEAITRALAYRSRQLWRELREVLDGEAGKGDQRPLKDIPVDAGSPLSLKLYAHPLINQLEPAVRVQRSRLSHIPSNEFSRGLIDVLVPAGEDATTVDAVRRKLASLSDDSPIKKPLLAIASEAGAEVDELRQGIGEWFDTRMSALSAVYRQKTKWFLLVVGLVVAVALNVDAIDAGQQFYRDQALRTAVAQEAVKVANDCAGKTGTDLETCTKTGIDHVDGSLRLPVGWAGKSFSDLTGLQVLGWLLAAVALGQGAPFWFDLLRKVTQLRR